jgi:transcriptional regulator with XRE-family HTH domain
MRPIEHIRTRIFRSTQVAFAAIAGTTQGSVSRWENGMQAPSQSEMERIRAEALRLNLPWNDALFFEVPRDVEAAE